MLVLTENNNMIFPKGEELDNNDKTNYDKIKINEKCKFEQFTCIMKKLCCMKRSVVQEERFFVHNIARRLVNSMLDVRNILLKQDQFETVKLFHFNPYQNDLFNSAHIVIDLDYCLTDFKSLNKDFIYNYYYYNIDNSSKFRLYFEKLL